MNTTIKKRIEEINSGRVPEGYEKTSFGIFPCDWEKAKLSEISEFRGGGTPSTKIAKYWEGDIPWISSSDISEGDLFNVQMTRYITKEAIDNSATKLCPKSSIAVVTRVGVGKLAYIDCDYCASQDFTNIIRCSINKFYILFKLHNAIQKYVEKAQGTSIKGITTKELSEIVVSFPKSSQEQSRIAEILMQWDKAIELQEKYIKQLELRKKALMQRLLTPKEGWKEQNLGMLSKIEKGEQVNNLELTETGCFPMLNGGVAPSGYYYKANCKANTITISEGGNSCGYVNYMTEDFWSGGHCYTLSRVVIEKYYLFAYLKHIESKIMQKRVGSGLPNIQRSAIEKIKIYYPASIEEQKSIAEIFFNLDKIIVLRTKKLDKLIEQRKALQQYLLTGIVRV